MPPNAFDRLRMLRAERCPWARALASVLRPPPPASREQR